MHELRVPVERIAVGEGNLFFHYRDAKEISIYYFHNPKLCAKHEKAHVNSIYIVDIMIVRLINGVLSTVSIVKNIVKNIPEMIGITGKCPAE